MADFETDYATAARAHEEFGNRIHDLIVSLLATRAVPVHSVSHRVKDKTSAQRKMARPKSGYTEVKDLHDLLGVRVITYFTSQVDEVAELIEAEFDVDPKLSKDRRSTPDPDRFGYVSLHFVCRLAATRSSLMEWAPYGDLRFEIQIRTILQHSWAEIEHDLGYKTAVAIPAHIRRRFSRLAGLLEIADDEFNDIRDNLATYAQEVTESVQEGESAPIDRDSIRALIQADSVVHQVDQRIAQLYGATLAESVPNSYAGARAQELIDLGFRTTSEVVESMTAVKTKLAHFATTWLNDGPSDNDPETNAEGRYYELTPGISLFYLFLHLALERDDIRAGHMPAMNMGESDSGKTLGDVHAAIFSD